MWASVGAVLARESGDRLNPVEAVLARDEGDADCLAHRGALIASKLGSYRD